MEGRSCETPGCDQPAKLQCPTCIKLGIQVLGSLAIMGPICESLYREKERESGKVMERKQGLQEILNSECREAFSVISSASRLTGTYTRSFSCLIRNRSFAILPTTPELQALHKLAKGNTASQSSKKGGGLINPWPGYNFTGKLRPAAQV